jgi:integrase
MTKASLKPIEIEVGNVTVTIYRRKRRTTSGKTRIVYEVADKLPNGKRRFKGFSDETAAKLEAERIARQLATGNALAATMTNAEATAYGRAVQRLRPVGIDIDVAAAKYAEAFSILGADLILDAAKFYQRHRADLIAKKTVAEVAAELIVQRKNRGKSDRYTSDLTTRLKRFSDSYAVDISTVTGPEIQQWLNKLGGSEQTVKNYRTVLFTLFKFAAQNGYIIKGSNPVAETETISAPGGAIEIYSPGDIAALLKAASFEFLPFLALGAFAGLRAAEIQRLDWQDIRDGFVHVAAEKAKTRSRRIVPILPALSAWLKPYADKTGNVWKLGPNVLRRVRAEAAEKAKTPWKDNALRHSFISYRLAETQDAAKVALEAGNSPGVVFRHYREIVKPIEATAWFSIMPESPAQPNPADTSAEPVSN